MKMKQTRNKIGILIIILTIIFLPLGINWLILQPKWFSIVGYDTDWLSFWGSYMGGVQSSIIAIFILYKQIKQNHSENEDNRKLLLKQIQYTHEENEVNRKLELYSIDYHQQKEWLNDMRKACIRNLYSYDVNDFEHGIAAEAAFFGSLVK